MISTVPLATLLEGSGPREKLQQGWSPQCLSTPRKGDDWGVLKTTAVQAGLFQADENKALPTHLEPRPALQLQDGDLLLTCAGPRARCGVPALVRNAPANLMISGKMYRFRPIPDAMDPKFLEMYLLSPSAQALIDDMKTGISDSGLNLTKQRFLSLPVPLFSLSEQRDIVKALEDNLSHLEAASKELLGAQRRTRALLAAVSDDLIWGTEATQKPVKDLLAEPLRNGYSARRTADGTIRVVTLTAVTRRSFSEKFTKLTSADANKVRSLWMQPGDIFVQRANTPDLVGSADLYRGPSDWAIFPDLLVRLRADERQVRPDFLCAVLQTERSHRSLRAKAKGLAGTMPKVDHAAIAAVTIPTPSLDLQEAIMKQLNAHSDTVNAIIGAIDNAQKRRESLRKALLSAAFSGNLLNPGGNHGENGLHDA